jgi:hypothetical protein
MNRLRRKALSEIIEKIEGLDALREEIANELRAVANEEEDAITNMPDSIQESERGQQMREALDNLDLALEMLEEIDTESMVDYIQDSM